VRALVCLVCAAFAVGCAEVREEPDSGGVHPPGWADPASASFHGAWLAANQFPLTTCQTCHGDDFQGGAVGVSCGQSGCHQAADGGAGSPLDCTTCHGANGSARPDTGAHWAHVPFCSTCHTVPVETVDSVEAHASGDAGAVVQFGSFATKNPAPTFDLDGGAPSFDPGTKQCSNTYCHGAASPAWTSSTQLDCSGCHAAPPADHERWSRLTSSTQTCATCHPNALTDTQHEKHVNGVIDVTVTDCTTCHGGNGHANPPVDLDGGTDRTSRGVGAHARHLDPSLSDRISNPLLCNDCHEVPANVTDPGHIDHPQTTVRFPFGGSYDATNATCTVWCHWDKTPGPTWTDDTGDARQCDSCHGFPPVVTRANTPHPSVAGNLATCEICHVYSDATHVNGVVDFVQP